MEAKAKLFGHPIHQMLIVFPLGLLATAFFFDVGWMATNRGGLAVAAYYMIAASHQRLGRRGLRTDRLAGHSARHARKDDRRVARPGERGSGGAVRGELVAAPRHG